MYDVIIFTDNTQPTFQSIALGAFKVASVLRKNNYKTLVVNHLSKFNIDELKEIIDLSVSKQTKLIGFSSTFLRTLDYKPINNTFVFPQGIDFENIIIDYIKQKNSQIKFVIGGANANTLYPNKNMDYAIMGYSEVSVINLVNHITHGVKLEKATKNIFGVTVIDDRTAPSYDFTADEMIWEKSDILNHKVLPIEIGRGCIFKCLFCHFPLNGKKKLDYIKDTNIIYDELLKNYNNFGIEYYLIVDDTFNDSEEKLIHLESIIKKLPFQPKFWAYARLDLICTKPHTLDLLYNIGLRALFFGIETLNKKTGLIIGKGYSREKQLEMLETIKIKYPDMALHGSFIVGLPEEPLEDCITTLNQLENGHIKLDSWHVKPLYFFKEDSYGFLSDLNLYPEKYGYTLVNKPEMQVMDWINPHMNFKTAYHLTEKCMEISRKQDYFRVPGHDAFEYKNFGCDVEETTKTTFKNFDHEYVKKILVGNFLDDYKKQLKQFLQETMRSKLEKQSA